MAIRKLKPVTPTQRFRTVADFSEITCSEPEKSLLEPLTKSGGRNNKGRITVRHRSYFIQEKTVEPAFEPAILRFALKRGRPLRQPSGANQRKARP